MSAIGPTFGAELAAAGLAGLPITWTADGAIIGREALTSEQAATLDAVIAAHDPDAVPVAEPTYRVNSTGLVRFSGIAPIEVFEAVRIATVARLSKGRYRIGHVEDFGTASYSVIPSVLDAAPRAIRVTARTSAYVEVRVTDQTGAPQDAAEVTIKIERVVQA